MTLLESSKFPQRVSVWLVIWNVWKNWLTASILVMVVTAIGISHYLLSLKFPLWIYLGLLFLVVAFTLLSALFDLKKRLESLSGALYKNHPACAPGIQVESIRWVTSIASHNPPPYLRVDLLFHNLEALQVRVFVDKDLEHAYLYLPEPTEEAWALDPYYRGGPGVYPGTHRLLTTETPRSFTIDLPTEKGTPFRGFLALHGPSGLAVVSLEWAKA